MRLELTVENVGELMDEPGGFPFGVAVVHRFIRVERIIVPDDLPVLAPIAGEGPARQGLARSYQAEAGRGAPGSGPVEEL